MPSEGENCQLVTVTEEEIENCVRVVPRLDTLILVKAMGHRKRFGNPFRSQHAIVQSLKFRRKSSSLRDQLYIPCSAGSGMRGGLSGGLDEDEDELSPISDSPSSHNSTGGGPRNIDKYELIALSFVEMCVRVAGVKWGRERRRELAKIEEAINLRKLSLMSSPVPIGVARPHPTTPSTTTNSHALPNTNSPPPDQCPSSIVRGIENMRVGRELADQGVPTANGYGETKRGGSHQLQGK